MPVNFREAPVVNAEETAKPRAEIHIIKNRCKGCGFCIHFCPKKVLGESDEINARGVHPPRIVNEKDCIICNFCMAVCPDFAIFVKRQQ